MPRFKTMTRQEARDLIAWVKTQPDLLKAYQDPRHPNHREIVAHAKSAYYWAHDHPQDDNGQPRTWDMPAPPANIYAAMPPDEAQRAIKDVKADPDRRAILFDKTHPKHEQAAIEWRDLHERAHPEPPPGTLANQPIVKSEGDNE